MLPKKRLLISLNLFLSLFLLSCSDDEIRNEHDKIVVDPLIVGSWRHPGDPRGFSIAEDGTVTYLKVNQYTGKFVSDPRFQDRIEAINGAFKFIESDNCYIETDTMYSLKNGSLEIPISKGWQFPITYLPLDVETYVSKKREESYVKARIDLLETKFGNSYYDYNASDEFSDINMLSFASGSFIYGHSESDMECNVPLQLHHYIMITIVEPIKGEGIYQLENVQVRLLVQGNDGVYNLVFDDPSYFDNGQLTVSNYSEDEKIKFAEGSFEFTLSMPEFNGNEKTVQVKNGSFKIYENLE